MYGISSVVVLSAQIFTGSIPAQNSYLYGLQIIVWGLSVCVTGTHGTGQKKKSILAGGNDLKKQKKWD